MIASYCVLFVVKPRDFFYAAVIVYPVSMCIKHVSRQL